MDIFKNNNHNQKWDLVSVSLLRSRRTEVSPNNDNNNKNNNNNDNNNNKKKKKNINNNNKKKKNNNSKRDKTKIEFGNEIIQNFVKLGQSIKRCFF